MMKYVTIHTALAYASLIVVVCENDELMSVEYELTNQLKIK